MHKFVEKTAGEFHKNRDRHYTPEYNKVSWQIEKAQRQLKSAKGQDKTALLQRISQLKIERHKTPCKSKTDKVIKYIRYADDFIIGVKGDKLDCERIKQQLSDFIGKTLKMELSEEKTLITHSNQYARFLGYDIRVRRDQTLKPWRGHVARTLNGSVELCVPFADKIMPFLFGKPVIRQLHDGTIEPIARKYMFSKVKCRKCPLCEQCRVGKSKAKERGYSITQPNEKNRARLEFEASEAFRERLNIRHRIEEKNGEMKVAHGLDRADSVGLAAMRLQTYFTAFVVNVKRIVKIVTPNPA